MLRHLREGVSDAGVHELKTAPNVELLGVLFVLFRYMMLSVLGQTLHLISRLFHRHRVANIADHCGYAVKRVLIVFLV